MFQHVCHDYFAQHFRLLNEHRNSTYEPTVTKKTLFNVTEFRVVIDGPLQVLFAATASYEVWTKPLNTARFETT